MSAPTDAFEALIEELLPGSGRGSAPPPSDPAAALGLTVGKLLGRGAHGEVRRAHDPVLGREVALKLSRPEAGPEGRRALLTEARTTARLEHPAVLAVHGIHEGDQVVAVAYQLAPEQTLEQKLADLAAGAPWPLAERLTALLGVASAVARAHELGVVHGDLHAGNVCVDERGEPYVLDWSQPEERQTRSDDGPRRFSGHPSTAAPEQIRGEPPSMPGDVFAVGALLWESLAGRPLRPRRHDESLGEFLARWAHAPTPPLPPVDGLPGGLPNLCAAALSPSPDARPTARQLHRRLLASLGQQADAARRTAEADAHLARARDGLARFRELGERLTEEERVVLVQRTKVPGSAPIAQKRSLWEAEDRVAGLHAEQTEVWTGAAEAATMAVLLDADLSAARSVIADLWWERLRDAEANHDPLVAAVAARRVDAWDDGSYARILHAPAKLTLTLRDPAIRATATLHRYVVRDRVLVPEPIEQLPMPLREHPLPPGSYLVVVEAEGYAPTRYPVQLGRVQHRRGEVALLRPEQIGDGWVYVPGGPFRLGGDPRARQALDPCEPILGDRFVQRTCVTSADWKRFLDALPLDQAEQHAPGEAGMFGGFRPFWTHDGEAWQLPQGWHPQWPVMAVNVADAQAYAAWLSEQEGRPVRLPTEEEWEKASRGVDGRSYPWGHAFDPTFAHMRASQPGPPRPSVVGAYPVDCSVYGALDTSGGMREWTSSLFDEGANVIRGGTWGDDAHDMFCANRAGLMPMIRYSYISFRLVSEHPRP